MGVEGQNSVPLQVYVETYELFTKGKRLANNSILLVLAISSAYKGEGKHH